jgi:aromatic ring hydroxylase
VSLRSYQEYVHGLRDGRQVYYRDERIPDVTTHEQMSIAIAHAGIDFRLADDPRYRAYDLDRVLTLSCQLAGLGAALAVAEGGSQ